MITTERDGPVAVVIIDRPEARNALTGAMVASMAEAFAAFEFAEEDPHIDHDYERRDECEPARTSRHITERYHCGHGRSPLERDKCSVRVLYHEGC